MENYFFLKNYVTSEGAVSHNVLYYQPLPITRNQERFYDNNYFEKLSIVSTAFKKISGQFLEDGNCKVQNKIAIGHGINQGVEK